MSNKKTNRFIEADSLKLILFDCCNSCYVKPAGFINPHKKQLLTSLDTNLISRIWFSHQKI